MDLWQTTYDRAALPLLRAGVRAIAPFRPKVRAGLAGRAESFAAIGRFLAARPGGQAAKGGILFHATSVGEFLQAVPLILRLKEQRGDRPVYLSFFSPSVEKQARAFKHADLAFYLPEDTRANVRRMLALLEPSLVVFSKFDIWRNLVLLSREAGIPVAVTAGTLSPGSSRLSGLSGLFHRSFYRELNLICAISEEDARSFQHLGVDPARCVITGDTRFDQTFERASKVAGDDPLLRPFAVWDGGPRIALGSIWPADELHVLPALAELAGRHPGLRFILVPHEPTPEHLDSLTAFLKEYNLSFELYSTLTGGDKARSLAPGIRAVVVDRMGVLAAAYRSADLAFIGGGFSSGVHNVMEPACFNLPVLFGPRHLNSYEARLMIEQGGAFPVSDRRGIVEAVERLLADSSLRVRAGQAARGVVTANLGATGRTLYALSSRFPEVISPGETAGA
jgi:3-deoxy-D-manno-octulosonic-acid transferase